MPESRLESSGLTRQDDASHTAPDAFGRYRVIHQVGVGVLGPLFRATDPDENRAVAVKAFRLDLTPEQTERFADALADVVEVSLDEPAIVAPLDTGTARDMPYLVSEYVPGDSLDVVLRGAAGRPANAAGLVAQIADAVDAAHARGIVHGALHMRDVIVSGDRARVTGFGVASVLEHVGFRAPVRRPYAAPELVTGRRWGPEADRYAVAAIAYELLTGLRAAGTDDHLLEQLRTVVGPGIPDMSGLQQAFRNGLADDTALRPASAASFAAAIGAALGVDVHADAPSGTVVESPGGPPAAATPVQPTVEPTVQPTVEPIVEPAVQPPVQPRVQPTVQAAVPPALPDPGGDDDFLDRLDAPTEELEPADQFELVAEPVLPVGSEPAPDTGGRLSSVRIGVTTDPRVPDDRFAGVEDGVGDDHGSRTPSESESSSSMLSTAAIVVVAVTIGVALSYFLSAGLGDPGDAALSEDTASETSDRATETPPPEPPESLPGAAGGAVEREWSEAMVAAPPPAPVEDLPAAELARVPSPVDDPPPPAAPVESTPAAVPVAAPPVARPEDPEPAAPVVSGPGEVYVDTRPPGATVLIDGATVGVTPVLVPDVAPGPHRVRIELAGYRPWVTDVTVPAAERVRVGASLRPGGD